jgi:Conserved TM helix
MDRIDILLEPARTFLVQVGVFLPRILVAIAILIVGWLIAKAVKFAVVRALRAVNFPVLTEKAGIDAFLKQSGGETDTTDVLGLLVYWLTILTALMVASNSVGLIAFTELVEKVVLFVPRVIVAVIILAFGTYFARFIGMSVTAYCRKLDMPDATMLGRLAMYAIVVFVAMIAIDHLGLGDIIRQSFLIVLAGVALALAIAFGLGGQKRAADFLERWSRRGKHVEHNPDAPPRPVNRKGHTQL